MPAHEKTIADNDRQKSIKGRKSISEDEIIIVIRAGQVIRFDNCRRGVYEGKYGDGI